MLGPCCVVINCVSYIEILQIHFDEETPLKDIRSGECGGTVEAIASGFILNVQYIGLQID